MTIWNVIQRVSNMFYSIRDHACFTNTHDIFITTKYILGQKSMPRHWKKMAKHIMFDFQNVLHLDVIWIIVLYLDSTKETCLKIILGSTK